MSGVPEQEYFADGMVEDIITHGRDSKPLLVLARNSSFTYKGWQEACGRAGSRVCGSPDN
jgi:TolB-like protein